MKTKVKIFIGIGTDKLEEEINDWIEENNIIIQSISTNMTTTNYIDQYNKMVTLLYVDGISGI